MDHVYEYFEQRRAECKRLSLAAPEEEFTRLFSAAPDGQSGLMTGVLHMDDDAQVWVLERVVLQDGRPHRARYAYFLIIDGAEIRGYERHATHTPAEHRHLAGHESEPWPAVSFVEAVEVFWDLLSQERERQADERE